MSKIIHSISPILYGNSDIRDVKQISINFTASNPEELLPALESHSVILLGFRYKATEGGYIYFTGATNNIIKEYYDIGDSYGRSPDKGFILASPIGEALNFESDVNGSCLVFVAYFNSLAI